MIFFLIILTVCSPGIALLFKTGKRFYKSTYRFVLGLEVTLDLLIVVGLPLLFSMMYASNEQTCCAPTAINTEYLFEFLSILIFTATVSIVYKYKLKPWPPLTELLGGGSLFLFFILNIIIAIQIYESTEFGGIIPILIGNAPIFLWIWHVMQDRMHMIRYEEEAVAEDDYLDLPEQISTKTTLGRFLKYMQTSLVGFLPVVFAIWLFQYVFTQRPDGVIKMFTETYYHTFSTLTPLCENVDCGEHYLCSVAANGNPAFVRSKRLGVRNGRLIACNRQLLVCNAFEQWLSEVAPKAHQIIRRKYDKVGDHIHKNYEVYKDKRVSHLVYLLMKPVEWMFTLILYSVDTHPENRIEMQYTSKISIGEFTKAETE